MCAQSLLLNYQLLRFRTCAPHNYYARVLQYQPLRLPAENKEGYDLTCVCNIIYPSWFSNVCHTSYISLSFTKFLDINRITKDFALGSVTAFCLSSTQLQLILLPAFELRLIFQRLMMCLKNNTKYTNLRKVPLQLFLLLTFAQPRSNLKSLFSVNCLSFLGYHNGFNRLLNN